MPRAGREDPGGGMKALISACLLGLPCRYDGTGKLLTEVTALKGKVEWIPVCPEQLGGLATPRPSAERVGQRVLTREGADVTEQYRRGGELAAALAEFLDCRCALLKARSPSCGSGLIYDGTFSGTKAPGDGVTAQAVKAMGIPVFDEEHWEEFIDFVSREEME